jgi:hypothetical protein
MTPRTVRLARLALVILAIVLATWAAGWLGPVIVATVFAAIDGRDSVPAESALGAAAGWGLMLLIIVGGAGLRPLGIIGSVFGLPSLVLPLISILFATGLAWSVATLVLAARRGIAGSRGSREVPASPGR